MARTKLTKTAIRQAWKMRGTNRKNAFKRAWAIQKRGKRAKKPKAKAAKPRTVKSKPRSTTSRMGRKKPQLKIPVIATSAVIAVPLVPLPGRASIVSDLQAGKLDEVGKSLVHGFLGQRHGKFGDLTVPWYTVMIALGAAGSMIASKLGLNRYLTKVPFIRL